MQNPTRQPTSPLLFQSGSVFPISSRGEEKLQAELTGEAACALTVLQGKARERAALRSPLPCFIQCETKLLKCNTPIEGGSAWEPFANVSAVLPGCHRGSLLSETSPGGSSARFGYVGNCSCFSQLLLAWRGEPLGCERRGNESFLYFCAKAVSVLCNVFGNIFLQLLGNSPLRATFRHTHIGVLTGVLRACTWFSIGCVGLVSAGVVQGLSAGEAAGEEVV